MSDYMSSSQLLTDLKWNDSLWELQADVRVSWGLCVWGKTNLVVGKAGELGQGCVLIHSLM